MPAALLGRKVGMTRYYTEDGTNIPVTVIEAGPCVVTQVKTTATDGYPAVQIAFGEARPRRSTMPIIGHDAKAGTSPKLMHREVRLDSDEEALGYEVGQSLDATLLEDVKFLDVIGRSKGKGFAGVMKRHNFKGLEASHGVKRAHRKVGSIGGHSANLGTGPKVKKGKRLPGRMGGERVTARNLDLVSVVPVESPEPNGATRHLLLVKGPVPGPNRGLLFIRAAKRLGRQKARQTKSGA